MKAEHKKLFVRFLADKNAWDFYITGVAGTGKTTSLNEYVQYCIGLGLRVVVCAYTHKACKVLRAKIPGVEVITLHAFLKKRPTINTNAQILKHIEISQQSDAPEKPDIVFIDEFSMLGEADLMSIRELQDPDYDGDTEMKAVFIGDPFQLPPVKDQEAVIPDEPYWVKLTTQYRNKNQLQITIQEILDMLNGGPAKSLTRTEVFKATDDLAADYMADPIEDKIFLAYTNRQVQQINFTAAGKEFPDPGDILFCFQDHKKYKFIKEIEKQHVGFIDRFWDDPLTFGSKYNTLEFILSQDMCKFFQVEDEEGDMFVYATVFGTYNHKLMKEELGIEAAQSNKVIEAKHKHNAAQWSKANAHDPMARRRSLAWRKYLTFKEFAGMDFDYAMTIHKSQGSTYQRVYLDAEDLYLCAKTNFNLYLRLYYVAISRAAQDVITN